MIVLFLSPDDLLEGLLEAGETELAQLSEAMLSAGALYCFDGNKLLFEHSLRRLHHGYDPSLKYRRSLKLLHAVDTADKYGRILWPKTGVRRWVDLNDLLSMRGLQPITTMKGWCKPEEVAAAIKTDGLNYQVYGH